MMHVLRGSGGLSEADLARVVALLRSGEPVALPTETVYGLAAPALQPTACERIFSYKGRPLSDPLICHLPNSSWLEHFTRLSPKSLDIVKKLTSAFWPGPLTLVLPRSAMVPDIVTAGQETVAVRQSAHPVFRQIVEALGEPLAAPSANRFGRISPTQIAHVEAELGDKIQLAVDGGPCQHGIESTILAVGEESLTILRPGPILPEQIAAVVPECQVLTSAGKPADSDVQVPIVPGNLAAHYAPRTPLRLASPGNLPTEIEGAGVLAWRELPPGNWQASEILTPDGDPTRAAANFYAALRRLDASGVREIWAELPPDESLGRVLRDRLGKAAAAHRTEVPNDASSADLPSKGKENLKLNTGAAAIVGLAVLTSRLLGLAREVIFAGLFGAGRNMDAFFVAFKAPNLLRDLFAEGALSTAFITVFAKKIQSEGDASAWQLANKMATLTAVFMSAITLLGILGADWIIALLAPGFAPEKAAFTVLLTRIMYPFILLVSLAALVMGILNAKHVFGLPAMASSFFNLGSIIGGVGLGWWMDPSFGPQALIGLSLGTLIGGFLQFAVQLPGLRRIGYRYRPDFQWRDPGVKKILSLMLPSVIAGSAVQVNVMVNSVFASFLQDGAVSWLQYAFRLMQLPLGIFGVAIATVTLPVVAKLAATGDLRTFRETLGRAMRLAVFLTLPSAIGLALLAEPIISLIYQRGKFSAFEAARTAEALQFYAIGLLGYSCIKVLAPSFYSLDRRWIPMLVSFGAIGLNIVLNYLLIFQAGLGHRGLALSTSLSATANFLCLFWLMHRAAGGLEGRAFVRSLAACALAALGMVGVVWLFQYLGSPGLRAPHLLTRITVLGGLIAAAGGVYFALCALLQVGEIREFVQLLRRRLRRG